MSAIDWSRVSFVKASASSIDGNECVEVGRVGDMFAIRNSEEPDGPLVEFTKAEMVAFAEGVRAGEFDV